MALLIALSGVLGALAGVAGYLSPQVRNVESTLPDHTPETAYALSSDHPGQD